jgi:hypothetical protein
MTSGFFVFGFELMFLCVLFIEVHLETLKLKLCRKQKLPLIHNGSQLELKESLK